MNADVAQVVVLSALELEYEEVRAQVSELRLAQHDAGTVFEIGALPGRAGTVAIAVTGPGIQAAAVVTERAIATFRPRAVLFVGIAGALHSDLELGDVVVATKIYDYQGGAEDAEGFRARPQSWEAPHRLEQLARHVSRAWSGVPAAGELEQRPARVHFRPIATGAVVLNSRDAPLARQLHHSYSDAAAIEMESAGTAKAAHLNQAQTLPREVDQKTTGPFVFCAADREAERYAAASYAAGPVTPAPSTSSGTPSDTAPGAKLRQDRISLRAEDNAYLEEGMAGTAVPYSDLYFPTASGSELQLAPQGDAVMAAVPDQPGYPECRRAVQARHDGFVMAKPGSWLCVRTNHGNIAAVQILSVTAVPQSILLGVTVWHR